MKYLPEIRNDDVLQIFPVTKAQEKDLGDRSFREAFMETDKIFTQTDYPCTLAIVTEGIKLSPTWVDHIKRNLYRYKLEFHGSAHYNYCSWGKRELKEDFKKSVDLINKKFDVEVTTWYPPYGRKGDNPYAEEVCEELGIKAYKQVGKVDAKFWLKDPQSYPHINFHYWNKPQVETIKQILCPLLGIDS